MPRSTTRLLNAINPYGLTYAEDGQLYASGATVDGTRRLAVWRLTADGARDPNWGTNGVVSLEVPGVNNIASFDIAEVTANNFVVQAVGGGKVWLVKFTVSGNTGTFGTPREVKFGWSDGDTGWPAGSSPTYQGWGVGIDKSDAAAPKVVVFASGAPAKATPPEPQRTDADRWIARVLWPATGDDFAVDPSFNGNGAAYTVDGDGKNINDNARRGFVAADGTIYSSGYTNIGGNKVIIIKLKPDGTPDPAFNFGTTDGTAAGSTTPLARPGQVRVMPFTGNGAGAEAYNVVLQQSGRFITTGYGTSNFDGPTSQPDLVSVGFKADGLDATYGRAGGFAVQSEQDKGAGVGPTGFEDRGRDLVLLPDERVVHAGAYDGQAAIFVTSKDGVLDTTSGEKGVVSYAWLGNFFGIARSADGKKIAASGVSLVQTNDAGALDAGQGSDSIIVTLDVAR
ncbi:MAG: hypothetical protein KIT84_08950 [Labilithrix sp.]|nr:hypothetical protein [Labilithrix sp.]MCW5811127.1 hypothetical protein [Labilithrix sp.]